jgi:histidine ammonia-lyase
VEKVLAIEFMTAAQAMVFRRPAKTSPQLEEMLEQYRKTVPVLNDDRVLYFDLEKTLTFIKGL